MHTTVRDWMGSLGAGGKDRGGQLGGEGLTHLMVIKWVGSCGRRGHGWGWVTGESRRGRDGGAQLVKRGGESTIQGQTQISERQPRKLGPMGSKHCTPQPVAVVLQTEVCREPSRLPHNAMA